MKWLRGMSVLVATVLAVLVAPGLAFAHDVPDMTRTGSVSATLTYDDEAVPGGSVTPSKIPSPPTPLVRLRIGRSITALPERRAPSTLRARWSSRVLSLVST